MNPDLIEIPAKTIDEKRFLVVGKISGKYWSGIITYRKDINAKCELETALKNGNVGYRDKVMANRILDIYRYLEPEDNLVHVGGLAHMMKDENGKTLYEQLKSFNPKVIPLLEKYTRCSKVRQYLDY